MNTLDAIRNLLKKSQRTDILQIWMLDVRNFAALVASEDRSTDLFALTFFFLSSGLAVMCDIPPKMK